MALNFPNSPTNGQIYTDTQSGNRWSWDAANTAWLSTSTFTQTITVSSTAPGSPVVGQLWWNQDYGRLLVYYNDGTSSQWVDASPSDYTSQLAYNQANTVFGVANAAFDKANTALANTSGVVFAGNLNITGNVGIATTSPGAPISFGNLDGAKVYLRNNTNEYAVGVEANELRIASYSATTFYSGGYSGTERMRIDSSGRLTKPYTPLVCASMNSNGNWLNYYNNPTTVIFNDATLMNNGGYYNASTGIFTCPVTGLYRVSSGALMGNATYGFIYMYKNSTNVGHVVHHNPASGTGYMTCSGEWMVSCSANDTLKIGWATGNGGGIYGGGYNYFNVELIG